MSSRGGASPRGGSSRAGGSSRDGSRTSRTGGSVGGSRTAGGSAGGSAAGGGSKSGSEFVSMGHGRYGSAGFADGGQWVQSTNLRLETAVSRSARLSEQASKAHNYLEQVMSISRIDSGISQASGAVGAGDGQAVGLAEAHETDMRLYADETLFDAFRQYLPEPRNGRLLLLLSLALQGVLVALSFLGFHQSRGYSRFDCCNAWAVGVAVLFWAWQFVYYVDWRSIDGDNPAWHRSNLFAPLVIFLVIFYEWGSGALSMLANSVDVEPFDYDFSTLSASELVGFWGAVVTGLPCVVLLMVNAYVHRNNLGEFYYLPNEGPTDLVELSDAPLPVQGSWELRGSMLWLATKLGVETTNAANRRFHYLVFTAYVLQIPFYSFLILLYNVGQNSTAVLGFIVLGVISLIGQTPYALGALALKTRTSRRWNRTNLTQPYRSGYLMFAAFFFAASSVFFQARRNTDALWEDIVGELSFGRRALFYINTALMLTLLVVHILMSHTHRRAWCDGNELIELMLRSLRRRAMLKARNRLSRQSSRSQVQFSGDAGDGGDDEPSVVIVA